MQQKVYEAKRVRRERVRGGDVIHTNSVCVSQEIEKREHEEKQAAKADERRKKKEPGFDGHWYTDTDAHLKHSTRYSSSIHCVIFIHGNCM